MKTSSQSLESFRGENVGTAPMDSTVGDEVEELTETLKESEVESLMIVMI